MILDTGRENSRLKERLERIIREKRISHAYLFEGPSDIDKETFARGFIKGVLCPKNLGENCGACSLCDKIDHGNHEDITYFRKDGMSVKDAAIASLQEKIKVRPIGERNIMVICDSDTMTSRAQNRILKTLEEPSPGTVIMLLSENSEKITNPGNKTIFRIYDKEKTVCDVIYHRNKMGFEPAMEVLKRYVQQPDRDINRLIAYAKRLQVEATIKQYLEALL